MQPHTSGLTAFAVACAVLTACSSTYVAPRPSVPTTEPNPGLASQAVDALVAALHGGSANGLTQAGRTAVSNAKAIGIDDVSMRYIDTADVGAGDGSWTGAVQMSWRMPGDAIAQQQVGVTFSQVGQAVQITAIGTPGRPVPLWLMAPVQVVRDGPVTVIAQGNTATTFATLAGTAIHQVRQTIPWPDARLVLEVPQDQAALEQVLGVSSGAERGVAAFTGPADGRPQGPVHIFVNPNVIGSGRDAQIVLTHEAVHVATHAAGNTHLPAWLREGFADYVALRAQDLPLSITAGRALATVKKSGAPAQLPSDNDFNSQAEDFGEEYQFAWLGCRYLGELGGPGQVYAFYRDVSAGASVENALIRDFGFGLKELTARWRSYLVRLAA